MTPDEMREVFMNAHERLEQSIIFSDEAISFISSCARGHPYLIHLIGRQALITAARERANVITETAAKGAVANIALQGNVVPLEALYRKSIRTSPVREHILKKFAAREEDVIRTTDVYEEIANEIDVKRESISQYMGPLVSPEYGAILSEAGERYYRFNDSVFSLRCCETV